MTLKPLPAGSKVVLAAVLAAATVAACESDTEPVHLATAHQMGPVAYRDPAGAASPDGRWLAFTEGREVRVMSLATADTRTLGIAPSQVRYLAWHPGSGHLLVHERSFDRRRQDWFVYDIDTGGKETLWGGSGNLSGDLPSRSSLLEISWAPDGESVVSVVRGTAGSQVWRISAAGDSGEMVTEGGRLFYPVVSPGGEVACIERVAGIQHLRYPCARDPVSWLAGHQPYGHVAFSPDAGEIYYAAPREEGPLELWARPVGGGAPELLATAERDAYGPGVMGGGDIVYRSQWYMVSLSAVPANGGEVTPITTFQSETPTWNPAGTRVSFTFGRWRIATDDVDYPDIDQHIGIVDFVGQLPKNAPDRVVRQSYSEDQGMHWSPNGRWIAYHSHIDQTDDIYLIPVDDPSSPRLISTDGHETGWPRWSPDGRWIAYPSYTRDAAGARKSHLYVIPVHQETGETGPQRSVELREFPHDALQAEWTADSEQLVFEAAEGAGHKALYRVHRDGGEPERFHEWESNQVHSGIAVSPDGEWVAYIGPGSDGYFQVHRVPLHGGEAQQLTVDRTQKTQPAYDPTGAWLAYTVFSYEARFWRLAR
ncbi:MAG: hypothetical protein F4Y07_06535 [Gemmatimonadetes bacterium]|nr:hypothetical protein [Gemmatimonadota bacterium]MYE16120.1 hypothetical protein [Gemmatimonadota bacterium]